MLARILIDQDRCLGIGQCEALEPETMLVGDDGIAETNGSAIPVDRARALCDACPSGALSFEQVEGSEGA